MGLTATIARRSLGGHPGRTIFSILGVAVGIATVVAVFTLDHATVLSRTQRLDPGWGADLEVRPSTDVSDPRQELLDLEGVAGVAAFFQNDVRLRKVGDTRDKTARVRMVALEAGSGPALGVYHVDEGEDLGADGRGLLVGRKLAQDLGLGIGSEVLLAPPAKAAKQICIEGLMQELSMAKATPMSEVFRVVGLLASEGIGRKAGGRCIVADYDAGRTLLKNVFIASQFWVRRDEAVEFEALESDLSKSFTFERNASKAVGQLADERAFRNGVRMAGLFALLLGLFVIFHTLSMSLVERVKEVGALHALSASRGQIAKIFFTEALVISGAAGALGLAGGVGFAKLLLYYGITTLGVQVRSVPLIEVPWETVSLLLFLGVGIALLGSVYPILRVRGTDVSAALRGDEPGRRGGMRVSFHLFSVVLLVFVVPLAFFQVVPLVGADPTLMTTIAIGLGVLGALVGMPLFAPKPVAFLTALAARPFKKRYPLAGLLAGRNLEQNPGRIGASIAAIALVTAAFCGLKGMTSSLAAEIEVWAECALSKKVLVEGLPDLALDDVQEAFEPYPEVLGVESGDARVFVSFLLLGQRIDQLETHGPLQDDPTLARALREEQTILISERLARQRGLTAGDVVLIETSGHGQQRFSVICVADDYGYFLHPDERAYGIVDEKHLRRYFCVPTATSDVVSVRLDREADTALVETALRERFPGARGLRLLSGPDITKHMLDDLKKDFVLFDIILALTALLAGLGVLNGQLLSALERKKELGVLRALGMTPGQVAGSVLVESSILGLFGGGLGLLVGVGLTPVLVSSLRVLSGLALPLRSAGAWLVFALIGAVLVSVFAALYPIWRSNRMDAVRAVRTG